MSYCEIFVPLHRINVKLFKQRNMKKVLFTLFAVCAMSFCALAENGDAYTVDDNAIEQVFAQSAEVSISDVALPTLTGFGMENMPTLSTKSVNPWVAWAICWVVGVFGIHRHYMGTSGPMWLWYTITCGGIFGIVTTIDWVVLLVGAIQDNISDYCNNGQFFMWL